MHQSNDKNNTIFLKCAQVTTNFDVSINHYKPLRAEYLLIIVNLH